MSAEGVQDLGPWNEEITHISPQRLLKHAFDQIRHSKPDIHPDNQERKIQKLITLLFSI